MQDVTLKIPLAVSEALRMVARQEDVSPGQVIRDAIDHDLRRRLGRKGYTRREAGGALVLCQRDGRRLCKASELGYAYAALAKRFNRSFPGHWNALAWALDSSCQGSA